MKKTQNYQLNQWDASDRILREDFNEDNAKIDAAIATAMARNPYVPLQTIITTADAQQIDVDISTVDWSKFYKLIFIVEGEASNSSNSGGVRVNGKSGAQDYQYRSDAMNYYDSSYLAGFSLNYGTTHALARIDLCGKADRIWCENIYYNSWEPSIRRSRDPLRAGDLKTVNFFTEQCSMKAGLRITVIGARI